MHRSDASVYATTTLSWFTWPTCRQVRYLQPIDAPFKIAAPV
jgi:hypothetical protein